jgi:hypothetical protein
MMKFKIAKLPRRKPHPQRYDTRSERAHGQTASKIPQDNCGWSGDAVSRRHLDPMSRAPKWCETKISQFFEFICAPGILVRVALVAIIADHPAMCKLCGFADHSHKATPCPKCTVTRAEIFTQESLENGLVFCTNIFRFSSGFNQGFRPGMVKNTDGCVIATKRYQPRTRKQSSSASMEFNGPNLPVWNTLISSSTPL